MQGWGLPHPYLIILDNTACTVEQVLIKISTLELHEHSDRWASPWASRPCIDNTQEPYSPLHWLAHLDTMSPFSHSSFIFIMVIQVADIGQGKTEEKRCSSSISLDSPLVWELLLVSYTRTTHPYILATLLELGFSVINRNQTWRWAE